MKAASCLQFEEISDTSNTSSFIKFTNDGDQHNAGTGCWSYVGEQGGEQVKLTSSALALLLQICSDLISSSS